MTLNLKATVNDKCCSVNPLIFSDRECIKIAEIGSSSLSACACPALRQPRSPFGRQWLSEFVVTYHLVKVYLVIAQTIQQLIIVLDVLDLPSHDLCGVCLRE